MNHREERAEVLAETADAVVMGSTVSPVEMTVVTLGTEGARTEVRPGESKAPVVTVVWWAVVC